MNRKKIAVISTVLLAVVAGFAIGSQSGCKNMNSGSEFVGFPQSFADLAEKVRPSVVTISTEKTVKVPGSSFKHFFGPEGDPFGDFFHQFFGDMKKEPR